MTVVSPSLTFMILFGSAVVVLDLILTFVVHRFLFTRYSHGFWLWLQSVVLFLVLLFPVGAFVVWFGEFWWW